MSLPVGSYTQIAYVVRDIEAAIAHWASTLGAGPFFVFDNVVDDKIYRGNPGKDTNLAALGFLGATCIEIFQPTNDEPSMFQEVLDSRGEGVHHVLPTMRPITADEFDRRCSEYEAAGLTLATSGTLPTVGRVAYYDAISQIGQFIEVIELGPDTYQGMDLMYDAHLGWDKQNPQRSMDELFGML